MTDTQTDAPPIEAEPPPTPTGYRPPPRYRVVRAAPGSMWDGTASGADPLEATIVTSLTGGELEWFCWSQERSIAENDHARLRTLVAPYVTQWNCVASRFDPDTGELTWEALPPPAEAGAEVLERVDILTVVWLAVQIARAPTRLGEAPRPPSEQSKERHDGAPSEPLPGPSIAPSPTRSRSSRATPPASSATATAST